MKFTCNSIQETFALAARLAENDKLFRWTPSPAVTRVTGGAALAAAGMADVSLQDEDAVQLPAADVNSDDKTEDK